MSHPSFEDQYRQSGFASQRRYPNEALIRFLAGNYFGVTTNERSNIRILELGCGSGANLWAIAKEGLDAYGIDIAPTGIELCAQMLDLWNVNANLAVGDMRALPYQNEFFDAIVDVVSMQHVNLKDHEQTYMEVQRCLKKGGKFFQWHLGTKTTAFTIGGGKPLDDRTIDNIANPNMPLYNNGLTCFLSPEDATNMLENSGFHNCTIERTTRTYTGSDNVVEYLSIAASKQE